MSTPHVVKTGFSWEKDPNEVRRNLIREMNRVGAYRLEGDYSGGHDEGGLDGLSIYDKDGKSIDLSTPESGHMWDHGLHQAVEDLLSTRFYTWALECYVTGRVYVDLREKRAWTEGQEEVMTYQTDPDPIDIRW